MIRAMAGSIGRSLYSFLRHVSNMTVLTRDTLYWMCVAPVLRKFTPRLAPVFFQAVEMGVGSLGIVFLVSLFIGMVLALQSAYQLEKMGAVVYVGALVGVSVTREIGPLLTAIVVAGRVGAAITAELGTMKVSEEIDALETMGIHPVRFLIVPRMLALTAMLPCLTVFSDVFGIVGGYVVGTTHLGISPQLYLDTMFNSMVLKDLYTGLIKSVFFAMIIGLIACYQGIIVKGGAEGVGRSTTQSVVTSIVSILAADVIFTALFYFVFV